MSVAISTLPEIPQSEQRIRVQNSTSGFAMIPNDLLSEALKLPGRSHSIFSYIWRRTVSFRKFQEEIDVEEIMKATNTSRSTVQRSTKWLQQNGWLTIEEQASKKNIYGIPEKLLESHGCLVEIEPGQIDRPSREGSKILDLEFKENPITPSVVSTGNRPSRKGEGIVKIPDHPVAEKLKYCGVYPRTIVKLFGQYDPESMWVIIKQFEWDMALAHNVQDMAATLVWRIRNGVTVWKSEDSVANSGESSAESSSYEISPAKIAYWQDVIEKNFRVKTYTPDEFMVSILRAMQTELNVPASFILESNVLDLHGVEVAL